MEYYTVNIVDLVNREGEVCNIVGKFKNRELAVKSISNEAINYIKRKVGERGISDLTCQKLEANINYLPDGLYIIKHDEFAEIFEKKKEKGWIYNGGKVKRIAVVSVSVNPIIFEELIQASVQLQGSSGKVKSEFNRYGFKNDLNAKKYRGSLSDQYRLLSAKISGKDLMKNIRPSDLKAGVTKYSKEFFKNRDNKRKVEETIKSGEAPTKEATDEEPIEETSQEELIEETSQEELIEETSQEESIKETSQEEPIEETSQEEPIEETSNEEYRESIIVTENNDVSTNKDVPDIDISEKPQLVLQATIETDETNITFPKNSISKELKELEDKISEISSGLKDLGDLNSTDVQLMKDTLTKLQTKYDEIKTSST